MAGQGTIAKELLYQSSSPPDYVLVAVGGGGLIAGVGSYLKQKSPQTQVIAIESAGAPAFAESLKAGKVTALTKVENFADGIAVSTMGEKSFAIAREVTDDNLMVHEGAICSTILHLYNEEAIVVEPAGAVAVAALDQMRDAIQ
ncbi:unnamed protein product, partial [Cyprideis torosa]